jgi:S-sulfo-L-cysteine synthase (3-phospho-L-serine-dependent)
MPLLVFLESNTTGTGRLFMRATRAERCEPVLIAKNPELYEFAVEEAIKVVVVDTGDEAAVLGCCADLATESGLVGITSTSDYFVSTAARLAKHLGLPGPSAESILSCRDKELQYGTLSAAGVLVPRTKTATTRVEAVSAAREIGLPIVLKPVGGSGSVGVRLCVNYEQVADHADILLSQETNERGMPIRRAVLAQEFIDGPEFSVESLAGQLIGITRKYVSSPPVFIEMGHDFPAHLCEAEAAAVQDIVRRSLGALDLQWGATHTELRLARRGPTIIEVNPRLAGGYIPELVRLATGIDLIRQLTRRVAGRCVQIEPERRDHASIRFIVPERSGTLLEVAGQDSARAIAGVRDVSVYRPNEARVTLAGDFHDRVGHVIASAHDPTLAKDRAERALALLKPALS